MNSHVFTFLNKSDANSPTLEGNLEGMVVLGNPIKELRFGIRTTASASSDHHMKGGYTVILSED